MDESDWLHHCPECLSEDLLLLYLMVYTPREDYTFSTTNHLIKNLKILPIEKNQHRFKYKREAISRFARDVTTLLRYSEGLPELAFVPMPPSKTAEHEAYDDRIEQVANLISRSFKNVSCLPLLSRTRDIPSYHQNPGAKRSSAQVYQDLSINEPVASKVDDDICFVILDDVLTSGAHFSGARRRLLERFPGADIGGIFWAKAQT